MIPTQTITPEPEFYYCTIQDLRDYGITAPPEDSVGFVEGTVTDKRLQKLILLASHKINSFTNQFFQPWPRYSVTNGTGSTLIYTLQIDKIIEVFDVFHSTSCGTPFSIDPSYYVVKERFVCKSGPEFPIDVMEKGLYYNIPNGFKFTAGFNNWIISGVFGNIKLLPKIETKLLRSIVYGDTEIEIESTTGIREGDSIVIGDQSFIINKIESPSIVLIDPSLVDIESTSTSIAIRYGRIHDEIREATIRLVVGEILGPDSLLNLEDGTIKGIDDNDCYGIISEKTDNYSYTKSKRTSRDRTDESLGTDGTGDPYVDNILRRYLPPLHAEFV